MANQHVIGKTVLEVSIKGSNAQPFDLQKIVSSFCNDKLLPALEQRFDKLVADGQHIVVQKLEIDVRGIQEDDWEEKSLCKILDQIAEQMEIGFHTPDLSQRLERRPTAFGHFDQWIWFLEHGSLPTHAPKLEEQVLFQNALETVVGQIFAVDKLKNLLTRNRNALMRLVRQHPAEFLRNMAIAVSGRNMDETVGFVNEFAQIGVSYLSGNSERGINQTIKLRRKFSSELAWKELIWEKIWELFLLKNKHVEYGILLKQILLEIIDANQFELTVKGILAKINKGKGFSIFRKNLQLINAQIIVDNKKTNFQHLNKKEIDNKQYLENSGEENINDAKHESALGKQSLGLKNEIGDKITPDQEKIEKPNNAMVGDNMVQPIDSPNAIHSPKNQDNEEVGILKTVTNADEKDHKAKPAPIFGLEAGKEALGPSVLTSHSRQALFNLPNNNDYWYIDLAGTVLLHPFFTTLFKALGLLDGNNRFADEERQELAIHIMGYAATGKTSLPESALTFPKFLCGFNFETPLRRYTELKEEEINETDRMLTAVLTHWGKLGSSSLDSLRGGFLVRPGKLSYTTDNGWLLQVEQHTLDVLLNYLPWAIGMVRHPWMPAMLTVEWTG